MIRNLIFWERRKLTMTRSILRMVLTTLALVLLFAGSFNLKRTGAQEEFATEGAAVSECEKYTGCKGGPTLCGAIHYPDGTTVECGMR
jgi:hypothetical protein